MHAPFLLILLFMHSCVTLKNIYSFLKDLASDAYYAAHELVEFDYVSTMTIDTLMIVYQYLFLMGKEGEARNLFCVALQQMGL